MTVDDLVGPREVAALLDVQIQTVHVWRHRGIMPDPHTIISSVPIWRRHVIEAWAADTGRRRDAAI